MIADIIAGFLSGIIGAMGFGGGGILILYLTLYRNIPQLNAQGINLIFFIPSAIVALIIHIKNGLIKTKEILPFIIAALPGVALGLYLTTVISSKILADIFGALLILMGIKEFFSKKDKQKRG